MNIFIQIIAIAFMLSGVLVILNELIKRLVRDDGIFWIDLIDPMEESLRLEIKIPFEELVNRKYVKIKVITTKDGTSREKHSL